MLKRVAVSFGLVEHTDKNKKKKKKKNKLKAAKARQASPDFSQRSKDFLVRINRQGGQQELYRHAVPASELMTKYPGMCVARPEVFRIPHQSVLLHDDILLPGHKYILIAWKDVERLKRKHSEQGKDKETNGHSPKVVAREILDTKTRSPSMHSPKVVAREVQDTKTRSPTGHSPKENGKLKVPNLVAGQETLLGNTSRSPNGHRHRENGKIREPNGVAGQEVFETRTNLSPSGRRSRESSKVHEASELGEEIVNTMMGRSLGGGVEEEPFCSAKDFYISTTKSLRRKGIKGKKPFVPPLPKGRLYRGLGWQPSLPTVKELSP